MDTIITFAGGLGLVFIGVKLLSAAIQQMAGHRFRGLMARLTESYAATAGLGFASGALTQNIGAVFFTLSGLVAAEAISVKRAADVLSWSYIGLSLIIFLVTVDTRLFVLCILAIAGLLYFFDLHRAEHTRHLAAALLSAGLLMLGILTVGEAAAMIQETAWLRDFVALAGTHPLIALAVGVGAGIVLPSLVSLSVVAVSLVSAGALDFLTTCFLLTGGAVGYISTAPVYVVRLDRGTKVLAYFDLLNRLLGAAVVMGLLLLEWQGLAAPIGQSTRALAGDDLALGCAFLFVFLQAASLVFALLFRDTGLAFVGRFARVSVADSLATPRFLPSDLRIDPDTALDLAERELARLPPHLTGMIETVRSEPDRCADHSAADLRAANGTLAARIEAVLHDVLERSPSRTLLARGSALQHRVHLLRDLTDSLDSFLGTVETAKAHQNLAPSVEVLVESLHLILDSVADAMNAAAVPDRDIGPAERETALAMARSLTGDRSGVMQRMRDRLGGETAGLDRAGHQALFDLTSLFDRLVWLLHRLLPR